MKKCVVALWSELKPLTPTYALVANVDLVVIRSENNDEVSVLYGRCLHRGALMSDGHIDGENLICGLHNWDYSYKTGVSSYNPSERLHRFNAWIEEGQVWVDQDEINAWAKDNPQPYDRDAYQGLYKDIHGGPEEPHTQYIQHLAEHGLSEVGHHGRVSAMGVPRDELPEWEHIQILTAQLHKVPLLDDEPVGTEVVIGPNAQKPLVLEHPLFVSDMSFGALSEEAKVALAMGAEMSGTGICSGEGGMLPEEQAANSRYLYELASARFGYSMDKVQKSQAFHFKCGQGAKTGTGGHLPGSKVKGKIAAVRELNEGEAAISPSRFPDWDNLDYYRRFAQEVREATGGIPVGVKLSAQHIERDIEAALQIGVDYIILDGRGGGTGAAPLIFRDNISVPTIAALARARRYLDKKGRNDVSLVITGGLRLPADFIKALALGADAVAVSNSALQAIGCLGMRACHTNNCPVGIATQNPDLRQRLKVEKGARQLNNFFRASTELMQVMARACGHDHLNKFCVDDLTSWDREMSHLTGIAYGGVSLD
ncbi:MAG: alpha-hydroxy-acid oxidizing protein [gamma proteobacterium symbiont of Bathyaustriella thionipta]|nr:alpha-hydroxy-acid oxidizing protein [gamma proteobacterium symbiont of Bathyaustriella thionipta]MCU7948768.1 alpha-hydroxy-acid oxidizing protein [gamma proteobacterium symbiont of Bathyaustriella thionipta]MCU7954995.1 alpha-hydroxy-acid oxidizing protein [gamma proteobacterium symbiont of Bathyaustriella thionipta]MCU7955323.1 alpha-hydroxy-acid oxidizing protein [gamma proteobacterium symbiont of Bathyaustriella thionipta]MCU7967060.1 alpha-hydroxy-acid oxidizing protein [gamma proteoba